MNRRLPRGFRTGVSLHSHTLHSIENLSFLTRLRLHWTPPLSAQKAFRLEAAQIESLGLAPLVSISDHDNIDASGRLHLVEETRHAPISVEWTVPFGESFFHIGIHNLPASQSHGMMEAMAGYTASAHEAHLSELFEWISWNEQVLVVFNHPCWDEKGIGGARHHALTWRFLKRYGRWVHAIELNGLRPWRENQRALALAEAYDRPVISGGDRHGYEPNANINLTNATTFTEFVSEVRAERISRVQFLPQYSEPLALRQLRCTADVLRHQPMHSLGWTRWHERCFYRMASGKLLPLNRLWSRGAPAARPQCPPALSVCEMRVDRASVGLPPTGAR